MFLAPLVLLAWANLHGSFPLGLLALGWALLDDVAVRGRDAAAGGAAPRRDLLVLVVSALATCVTPFGPGVWGYAAALATTPAVAGLVSEWQPTSIHTPAGAMFVASVVGMAALIVVRRRRTTWPTLAWLAVLFLLGAWTERGIVWWAIGAAVAAAVIVADPVPAEAPRPRRASTVNGVLVLVIVAAPVLLASIVLARPADPVLGPPGLLSDAPPGITAAVREAAAPGARILNAQRWGSWLEWAVPDALVHTDSRFEVIPESAWRDHVALSGGRFDWREILDRVDPDLIVASRTEQAGLLDALAADPSAGWRTVFADDDGAVLAR
jgi:hypothetical protein